MKWADLNQISTIEMMKAELTSSKVGRAVQRINHCILYKYYQSLLTELFNGKWLFQRTVLPPFELIIDWSEQLPYPFLRNRLQMRPYVYKVPSHTHAHPLYYTPFNWKLGKWINTDTRAQRLPLEEKRRTSHKPNTMGRLRLELWPGGTAAWLDSSPCSP